MKPPEIPCCAPAFGGLVRWRQPGRFAAKMLPLAVSVLLFSCGCSTFHRDWKRAARQTPPPDSIEGRWEGRWLSDVNSHTGNLRCLITRTGEDQVAARFRATYAKIFRFSYTVPLEIQPHYGGWEFNGEADLGKLAGGEYYYEGRASPTNFFSTYRSKHDHGTFEMHRPELARPRKTEGSKQ